MNRSMFKIVTSHNILLLAALFEDAGVLYFAKNSFDSSSSISDEVDLVEGEGNGLYPALKNDLILLYFEFEIHEAGSESQALLLKSITVVIPHWQD